jgi:ribose 5-phosphate isomerase A
MPKTKLQIEREKEIAAEAALRWVRTGMVLGLGSGSTSRCFIRALGEQMKRESLSIHAVAASKESEALAIEYEIPLIAPARGLRLDLAVDGADEIAPDLALIKGGGGAHLREKAIAVASACFLVIADSTKLVDQLGKFPLPIEVVPFTLPWVLDQVEELGGHPVQRLQSQSPETPFISDQGNYIVDCHFGSIPNPLELARELEEIPGIAGHGLFLGITYAAIIAEGDRALVYRSGEEACFVEDFEILS